MARRNYKLVHHPIRYLQNEQNCGSLFCMHRIHTVDVYSPTWQTNKAKTIYHQDGGGNDNDNNNNPKQNSSNGTTTTLNATSSDDEDSGPRVVRTRFFFQYKAKPDPSTIYNESLRHMLEGQDGGTDILLWNFGLHWQRPNLIRQYYGRMKAILQALKEHVVMSTTTTGGGASANTTNTANDTTTNEKNQNNKFKLLLFRETSAQHFPFPGGDWGGGLTCTPLNFTSANATQDASVAVPFYREVTLRNAAWDTGFNVFSVGPASGQGGGGEGGASSSGNPNGTSGRLLQLLQPPQEQASKPTATAATSHPEIIMLPYAKFTSDLYDLHPDECTHYCSTPFLWMPLWRSFRLAMEWKFNGL
jgi:hypothetical protein